MKRNLLAVIIPALFIAQAAQAAEIYNKDGNKLDFYGRVKAMHYFSDDVGNDGDKTYVRIGFKGATQINDILTGYGQWEYQIAANHSEADGTKDTKTRLGFAGLKVKNFGSFDYGRNYGVIYDVAAWTDMLPEFGDDTYIKTDNFMTGRANGVATYRNNDFFGMVDGLKFALQYQGKNENDDRSASKANGDGFGLSSSYEIIDGVSVSAAYAASNRTKTQKDGAYGKGDTAEVWAAGLKYDANSVYLATTYAETHNLTPISGKATINNVSTSVSGFANKTQNVEVVAQYQFDFGLRPSLAYVQSKGKDIENIGDVDLVKYIDVGTYYYFNKNMSTYVDYKINQLSDDNKLGLKTDNIIAVALTYQF
ncbi:putative porin [Serratia fonticola]|jgi:outer membrane pore protein E|uniref:Putative porin n=1 Tax=Serratia fonticola TaxID=47917 RepID=A0A559SZN1_SERFO|nr:porin OmpC [Serratia fonticola]TQI79686.1 putative porin [Serratia fonticola]TQI98288.1 putative porin [Serratia fonticola]TVZ67816.1 putative porin [Serratia fonticola]